MKKIVIFLIFIYLNAGVNYKIHKTIQFLNDFSLMRPHFLPIEVYNVFPFVIKSKKIDLKTYFKKQSFVINVKAIANERAFINNKWYKKGDKIQNFIIYKITANCVFFKTLNVNISKKTFSMCITPNVIEVVK